ncbi:MAG: hypothetical protein JWM16_1084 [Verrucomicrobiales bacterium]|nr:hypothetical protein [Verrucomicrobiales bacterium]
MQTKLRKTEPAAAENRRATKRQVASRSQTLDSGPWSLDNSPVAKCSLRKANVGSCRLKKIPRSCSLIPAITSSVPAKMAFTSAFPQHALAKIHIQAHSRPSAIARFKFFTLITPQLPKVSTSPIKVIQGSTGFQRQDKAPQKIIHQVLISSLQPFLRRAPFVAKLQSRFGANYQETLHLPNCSHREMSAYIKEYTEIIQHTVPVAKYQETPSTEALDRAHYSLAFTLMAAEMIRQTASTFWHLFLGCRPVAHFDALFRVPSIQLSVYPHIHFAMPLRETFLSR